MNMDDDVVDVDDGFYTFIYENVEELLFYNENKCINDAIRSV